MRLNRPPLIVDAVLHLERSGRISMEERMSEDLSAIISFFPRTALETHVVTSRLSSN